jgi:Mg-chelatase subunit ChlD
MILNLKNDQRGGIAIMAGLTFGLFAVAAAAGLDYTNATNERHALQKAADAAVLAGASMPSVDKAERIKRVEAMFMNSKFCQRTACSEPRVRMINGAIEFQGGAMVETSVLQIAGLKEIEIGAFSRAAPATEKPVDVVMILDYSGSMKGLNKYQNMAAAATQFVESADQQPGDLMSVGVVPFSEYVLTPMHGRYLFDVSTGTNLMGKPVVGCVLNREHPHSTNAEEPMTSTPGSLWPVFSYAESGSSTFTDTHNATQQQQPTFSGSMTSSYNGVEFKYTVSHYDVEPNLPHVTLSKDFVFDAAGTPISMVFDAKDRLVLDITPLNGMPFEIINPGIPQAADPFASFGGYGGSDSWTIGDDSGLPEVFNQDILAETLPGVCSAYASNSLLAQPLSQNFDKLKTAISKMRPIGLTNIALGLDLGWHMLTPEQPFKESSGKNDAQKVAILLSDGVQTVSAHGSGGAVSIASANANITESCEAMKEDGVEIFTIAFGVNDAYTRDLLRQCASREPNYFEPSAGGNLDDVFESIFDKVTSGDVRLTG